MRTNYLLFFIIPVMAVLINGCKKDDNKTDDPCPNCSDVNDALEAYDKNSGGVYRGTFIGSSGYYTVYLKNGSNDVYCSFTMDGKTTQLNSTSLTNWSPGQAVDSALFTGSVDGKQVNMFFSVDSAGKNDEAHFQITGHNIVSTTYKQISNYPAIQIYEGSYAAVKAGQPDSIRAGYNVVIANFKYYMIMDLGFIGVVSPDSYGGYGPVVMSGSDITGWLDAIGHIDKEAGKGTGSFKGAGMFNGNWKAERVL